MDQYILDGKTPRLVSWTDYLAYAKEKGDSTWRQVAKDSKDGVMVSTVFLTIDHAWGGGAPVLFETMIFGGPHDEWQDRYHTWDEAEAGHATACEMAGITPSNAPK